jgi:S1-C subfamily serine protease
MHFFTGSHADYHRPGDDWEKINAEGAAKVLSLIYDIGWDLVSSAERPTYQKVAAEGQKRTMMRVRFGIMPSYGDNEEGQTGMVITGVSPESPADKAGLQAEDRITQIDDHKIDTVYDFMAALGEYEPKDVVTVVVDRGGKPVRLKVTLEASQ